MISITPLTSEQIEMLKSMGTSPIEFDEDCPELTKKQLNQLKRVSEMCSGEREERVTLKGDLKCQK